jgi:uncharacterized membrane protein YraQ (UPF0718 family)
MIWGNLSLIEKGMVLFTLLVYVLFAVYSPSTREKTAESVVSGANSLIRISLLLLSGIFLGSLVGTFLPRDVIAGVLGKESGFNGILLGTLFGAVLPGGPFVLFPVLAALYSSGAGIPPMVAMIFAWSCIALTRIPMELGYLSVADGQKIIWLRVLLGIPVPIVAGLLAGFIVSTLLKM